MNETSKPPNPDFVDKALRAFDHVLDLVHDKVLRPIILTGRVLAFGLILVLAALVLLSAFIIGTVRILNVYAFAGHEWLSYLLVGTISLSAGLILWRRRSPVNLRK